MEPIYEIDFLKTLLITLGVEVFILWLGIRFLLKLDSNKISQVRILGVGFLSTFATLPYVWFIFPAFLRDFLIYTLVAEIGVFIFEGLLYIFLLRVKPWQGMLLSLVCNGLSFGGGLLIKALI